MLSAVFLSLALALFRAAGILNSDNFVGFFKLMCLLDLLLVILAVKNCKPITLARLAFGVSCIRSYLYYAMISIVGGKFKPLTNDPSLSI